MAYEKETTYEDWFIDYEPATERSLCNRICGNDCASVTAVEFVNLPVGHLTVSTLWVLMSTSQVHQRCDESMLSHSMETQRHARHSGCIS